jgi:hypothetical protein
VRPPQQKYLFVTEEAAIEKDDFMDMGGVHGHKLIVSRLSKQTNA